MRAPLALSIADYREDGTHWRWTLTDAKGGFLADHEVTLDPSTNGYRAFVDLPGYLERYATAFTDADLIGELGTWIGAQIFGPVLPALRPRTRGAVPVTVVRVRVPAEAQALLFRPFELARLDGEPLALSGVRFVYEASESVASETVAKPAAEESLRVLAVFSLPDDANPLNLRRERYQLERLLRHTAQPRGWAIDLRVLQYGATRATLREALEDGRGWDIVHFSGHGLEGELLLENEAGDADRIEAHELLPLLSPAGERLKLLTLSSCLSAAGSLAQARAQLGLTSEEPDAPMPRETQLPSLAQTLSQELDCAALAMRYPVGDEFALTLTLELYKLLIDKGQPLPAALQLALRKALAPEPGKRSPALSAATPVLFGDRASDLRITAPTRARRVDFEATTLGSSSFPEEPERFVGRLLPMLRASSALAPESRYRGVLFHGMPGVGKTWCAVELAYRHERERFMGYVWHEAPAEGQDIAAALTDFLSALETLFGVHDRALQKDAGDPDTFKRFTLPRLRGHLSNNAWLIVLDNIESLLASDGAWRDPLWGKLVETLLAHTGTSRLVLTSSRVPATLAAHPALLREAIHPLTFSESVLLARELANLRPLFRDEPGRALLTRALAVSQGHPMLLDLAEKAAARGGLEARITELEHEVGGGSPTADAFLATGESEQGELDYARRLTRWTVGLLATLPPATRLAFHFLCRLEETDRRSDIVSANWKNVLTHLKDGSAVAEAVLGEPLALDRSLQLLASVGLIESRALPPSESSPEEAPVQRFRIHRAVATAGRADGDATDPALAQAVDVELGDYWSREVQRGLDRETAGGSRVVAESGGRGAPYLLRGKRWLDAGRLLEGVTHRDWTPATLAATLPKLREIVEATTGTEENEADRGVLAGALLVAGRYTEAEEIERGRLRRALERGDYRRAAVAASTLIGVLRQTGGLEEALEIAEQRIEYVRRAGLGPWSKLSSEVQRLEVVSQLGGQDQVLAEAERLRTQLDTLPETSEAPENTTPWQVREGLLATGRNAAIRSNGWAAALDWNAELVRLERQRGVSEVTIASSLMNDYVSLLALDRYAEVRVLLESCRATFKAAHDSSQLGMVYGALAHLESQDGAMGAAVRFARASLSHTYRAGVVDHCGTSHHNFAIYLMWSGSAPEPVWAHLLAAALIWFQSSSHELARALSNLAASSLPAASPPFESVVALVEEVEGVRFRELFARLPARAPSGDAAVAAVWELVQKKRAEAAQLAQRTQQASETMA